ncbi:hypothetical protein DFH09DRAFT_1491284 [Mycena vulgaris]|nr:hypothetical protein DFH09DRAFT_1491284 [Mycena vulgaris]
MNSSGVPVLCKACGHNAMLWKPNPLLDPTHITQLHDVLRSDTYTPAAEAHFRRVISEAPSELAIYDAEMENLQRALVKLVADRDTLRSHLNGCRSVFSPVRRLPAELLVDIFDMCAPPCAGDFIGTETAADELDRLSKWYLLQISQVCSRWNAVTMGTPRLWSTIVVNLTLWNETPASSALFLDRLESSLERGGSYALTLKVALVGGHPTERPVCEALVKHSRRWRDVHVINFGSLEHLAGVKGNLPLLEDLHITDHGSFAVDTDFFEVAPRLKNVIFDGLFSRIPKFPWEQLYWLDYRHSPVEPTDLLRPLSLTHHLSPENRINFFLVVDMNIVLSTTLPKIVSDVRTLCFQFVGTNVSWPTETLGGIFNALTLPSLQQLDLHRQWVGPIPVWEPTPFMEFASRSSLRGNLTTLVIHILITDEELLQCLAVLPMLTTLIVSDCGGDGRHIVTTDTLLRRLTWTADDSCLIPSLHFFAFTSLFRYTDDAYWDFLTSRLVPGHTVLEPFKTRIWWLLGAGRERDVSPELLARISAVVKLGQLDFGVGQDPYEPPGAISI